MPEQLDEIVIAQEDRKLEQVLGTISNIKGQTLLIGNELSEQANLLEDLGRQMDHTDSRLTRARKQVEEAYEAVLDTKFTLVTTILILVLIFLFILLIAT